MARERMTTGAYLGRLVASRPLYRLLYREAMSCLAPGADSLKVDPITCALTLTALAKALKVSRTTVSEDMRRLVNHAWVREEDGTRLLGHRHGVVPMLLSDCAAEEATGEVRLVSTVVLGLPDPDVLKDAANAEAQPGRGLRRKWRPSRATD